MCSVGVLTRSRTRAGGQQVGFAAIERASATSRAGALARDSGRSDSSPGAQPRLQRVPASASSSVGDAPVAARQQANGACAYEYGIQQVVADAQHRAASPPCWSAQLIAPPALPSKPRAASQACTGAGWASPVGETVAGDDMRRMRGGVWSRWRNLRVASCGFLVGLRCVQPVGQRGEGGKHRSRSGNRRPARRRMAIAAIREQLRSPAFAARPRVRFGWSLTQQHLVQRQPRRRLQVSRKMPDRKMPAPYAGAGSGTAGSRPIAARSALPVGQRRHRQRARRCAAKRVLHIGDSIGRDCVRRNIACAASGQGRVAVSTKAAFDRVQPAQRGLASMRGWAFGEHAFAQRMTPGPGSVRGGDGLCSTTSRAGCARCVSPTGANGPQRCRPGRG